jgi:putative ABC transport system substrate-binding protein
MRRRDFITLIGGAAAAPVLSSLAALAQQPAMPVVGFLNSRAPGDDPHLLAAFREGMDQIGYFINRNVAMEYRWAEGQNDRLPALAADLVRRQVTVIAANAPAALPAKAATMTIPVVFNIPGDPVALGLVASLNRPGGNITGITTLNVELEAKRLELLHELVPTASALAAVVNPTSPNAEIVSRDLEAAAHSLGLQLHVLHASTEGDFATVFEGLRQLGVGGVVIGADAFYNSRSERLAALSVEHRVPTIFQTHQFAAAGGLISYASSLTDSYRLFGVYTGRILKGEKPADLPVQQSTKVELTINLKTAKALGLTVPLPLLGRADEVIE